MAVHDVYVKRQARIKRAGEPDVYTYTPVPPFLRTPGESGAIGVAFIFKQFEVPEIAAIAPACVMVTVPANALIATLPTDRMPAILADEDWEMWLTGTGDEAKACLKPWKACAGR